MRKSYDFRTLGAVMIRYCQAEHLGLVEVE